MVKASVFYPDIKDRYEAFNYDNLTTLNYTDAIIDFDASRINSLLKSDYILFEERPENEYNHMGIAKELNGTFHYVETFFHEKTKNYINGQIIVKIKSFKVLDADENIIVSDAFNEKS